MATEGNAGGPGTADPAAFLTAELRRQALGTAVDEPMLAALMHSRIIERDDLAAMLSATLSQVMAEPELPASALFACFAALYREQPALVALAACDLNAAFERDAAVNDYLTVLFWQKGFQALQLQRLSHVLWQQGRRESARHLNYRANALFGVDIHPACPIGRGVMLDHATGIVVGETAEIGDNVSILQGVTLGGTGKESGARHPRVKNGVLIGAGATVLGNIEIGHGAQIGAGSVVLHPVEAHTTVVGIPARQAGRPRGPSPSVIMEHCHSAPEAGALRRERG